MRKGDGGSETNTQLCEVLHKRLWQDVYRDWTLRTIAGREVLKVAVSTSVGKGING